MGIPIQSFGMNALASYALSGLVIRIEPHQNQGEDGLPALFYKNITSPMAGPYLGSFLSALIFCFIIWLLAYALYRNKIFIKA